MSLSENNADLFSDYLELFIFPGNQKDLEELISVKILLDNLSITGLQNPTVGNTQAKQLEYTYPHDRSGEMKPMKIAGRDKDSAYLILYKA